MSYIDYVNEFCKSYIYYINESDKSYIVYVTVIKIENKIWEEPTTLTNTSIWCIRNHTTQNELNVSICYFLLISVDTLLFTL